MTTSPYFNNFNATNEQGLLEDLIIESIQIYGQDMIYLPRKNENFDNLYGTSDITTFNDHYTIEMYIKSVDGFGGDGNFLSKFGLEIRDQVTFTVAKKRFESEVWAHDSNLNRPREGDLIYFPLNKRLFEIKYADNKPTFYQLGALQVYNLTCELYEYSSERFETGISVIDDQAKMYTQDVNANTIPAIEAISNTNISFKNNNSPLIKTESDPLILFSDSNPFSELN